MDYPVTSIIAIVTILVSLAALNDQALWHRLMFSPYRAGRQGEWYRVFTHAFVHADIFHLILNMYVLWNFGRAVEAAFAINYGAKGIYLFVLLYLGGILFATTPGFAKHIDNSNYLSLGASGAVSAVVFSFILISPDTRLMLLFLPIPIPAYIFGVLYLLLEFYLDRRGGSRVAHDAHFWGAVFGIVFTSAVDIDFLLNFLDHFGG